VWQQVESSSTLESPPVSIFDHIHATENYGSKKNRDLATTNIFYS
jgi:hypothetical protein